MILNTIEKKVVRDERLRRAAKDFCKERLKIIGTQNRRPRKTKVDRQGTGMEGDTQAGKRKYTKESTNMDDGVVHERVLAQQLQHVDQTQKYNWEEDTVQQQQGHIGRDEEEEQAEMGSIIEVETDDGTVNSEPASPIREGQLLEQVMMGSDDVRPQPVQQLQALPESTAFAQQPMPIEVGADGNVVPKTEEADENEGEQHIEAEVEPEIPTESQPDEDVDGVEEDLTRMTLQNGHSWAEIMGAQQQTQQQEEAVQEDRDGQRQDETEMMQQRGRQRSTSRSPSMPRIEEEATVVEEISRGNMEQQIEGREADTGYEEQGEVARMDWEEETLYWQTEEEAQAAKNREPRTKRKRGRPRKEVEPKQFGNQKGWTKAAKTQREKVRKVIEQPEDQEGDTVARNRGSPSKRVTTDQDENYGEATAPVVPVIVVGAQTTEGQETSEAEQEQQAEKEARPIRQLRRQRNIDPITSTRQKKRKNKQQGKEPEESSLEEKGDDSPRRVLQFSELGLTAIEGDRSRYLSGESVELRPGVMELVTSEGNETTDLTVETTANAKRKWLKEVPSGMRVKEEEGWKVFENKRRLDRQRRRDWKQRRGEEAVKRRLEREEKGKEERRKTRRQYWQSEWTRKAWSDSCCERMGNAATIW